MPYKLFCIVPDDQLGTIISTIQGCVTDLRIEPTAEAPTAKPARKVKNTGGAKPVHQTRAGRVVLEAMAKQIAPFSNADAAAVLEAQGYQGTGASPILSKLVTEGKVSRVNNGLYQLTAEH